MNLTTLYMFKVLKPMFKFQKIFDNTTFENLPITYFKNINTNIRVRQEKYFIVRDTNQIITCASRIV